MAEARPGGALPVAVEPFLFGNPALYGCLHPGSSRQRGVVICYPFAHEYITMHRAARQLATQLSRAGLPTLRFDYLGTGDSSGRLREARLDRWVRDVRLAVDELRQRTGVERVCLIGIRLGAALALRAAVGRDDVEALALWDPVIRGQSYLDEMRRDTRRMLRVAHVRRGTRKRGQSELVGFAVAPELEDDLRRLELDAGPFPPARRLLLLETRDGGAAPLGAALRAGGRHVDSHTDAYPDLWRWSEDITRLLLPHSQVRAIARWVKGEEG